DGLTFIGPSKVEAFMETLPVEKFYGVGKVTAAKMKQMQLHSGADLKRLSELELVKHFGKQGHFYYRIVRGIDDRPVQARREAKSVSVEDTFQQDLTKLIDMNIELESLANRLASRIQKHKLKGRTITLKIRFNDFSIINRSKSLSEGIDDPSIIFETSKYLLGKELAAEDRRVRLLGISLSNFHEVSKKEGYISQQLSLF